LPYKKDFFSKINSLSFNLNIYAFKKIEENISLLFPTTGTIDFIARKI